MKRKFRIILITIFLVISPLFMVAQQPPHPNGGANPGAGNGPVGGGAPIDSGSRLLLLAAMAYGIYRFCHTHNEVSITE
ncbi:MAG: hypothetical protein ACOYMF_19005 [Bacteroidales bacterium]